MIAMHLNSVLRHSINFYDKTYVHSTRSGKHTHTFLNSFLVFHMKSLVLTTVVIEFLLRYIHW